IREMEKNTYTSFFKTPRTKRLLLDRKCEIADLLKILVGEESLYEHYLFDQQFSHPGWSGMVSVIEENPKTLLDSRRISLQDIIIFELLLEIDALDYKYGENWIPLGNRIQNKTIPLFYRVEKSEYFDLLHLWQEAYEWSFYDQVLGGILANNTSKIDIHKPSFQSLFCIDDRECSLRRYIEKIDASAQTFGTPGFFNVAFYYKPMNGKFTMKVCPAPLNPPYLIKEELDHQKNGKDFHFGNYTHSLFFGWLITHTIGFWSAIRLLINIFTPRLSPAATHSFRHMDKFSKLSIENHHPEQVEDGLQVGFTVEEMADRVEGLLKSIGLVDHFAPIVYAVGHGASSVNNTHYAGYDCGACSGRPGSVNARVISFMANHLEVRNILNTRGIHLPSETIFIGALHDTTRDEIEFYDDTFADSYKASIHQQNKKVFVEALEKNAKERARRFATVNPKLPLKKSHEVVQRRSVSLFEPRPELNHATNALCIVGRRELTGNLFLDRRAFMNSYDYNNDPQGKYLFSILAAAAPVCGGINLEYYFSRVDNYKLGAGTKLPHNVMGLIGVANGIDGDLRPGLPEQMIEVHDPIRLMIIVEHYESIILQTIQQTETLYEWFENEWVHLVAVHPENKNMSVFKDGLFTSYQPKYVPLTIDNPSPLFEKERENLPVLIIQQ
ncbi:MAG: putative inorganic carbon transporter subunit DabA, partial [Saprospiraceae bacterium]